ncbi:MAG: NAD(P)-dependent oxidoreductase [Chloroflexi bacterium]|nr:NAD(P)-dependent oxidoreductase [Chloroflexota bacterium]
MQAILGEFLEINRKERLSLLTDDIDLRPAQERVGDFAETLIPFDEQRARYEASRCIHCPDPAPCVVACPADNDIPSAMWLIEQGEFLEAAELYRQTSTMPEICGRVCPHEQLCQGSCVRSKHDDPVLTGALEFFAADYQRKNAKTENIQAESSGKKVAVVGAGPSGLACAQQLVEYGHSPTIFDAKPEPGGLLLYGIPNFKLPKEVLSSLWEDQSAGGIEFVGNTFIGKDKSIDDLFAEGFEAVYVAIGTGIDAGMDISGEELPGVYKGTEYLIQANVDPKFWPKDFDAAFGTGRKVVVIGGGDSASDCLRSALRLGAEEVTCVYRRTEKEMPGGKKDRELARQEGAQYQFLTQPVRFIADEDGKLDKIECIKMELGEPDDSGRRPVAIEDSNFIIEADTAILAVGYWPDPIIGKTTPDLDVERWGLILTDEETGATSRPGVYAGGDAVTGPDLVVTAMVTGRKAACSIHDYLTK